MKQYTILIADDLPENLQIISEALKESEIHHKIIKAINGKILCEMAEKRNPDLIITDWEMPVMDGIEAIKYLKSIEATKDIPIIMCTGIMTTSENLKVALDSGAVDFIRKPINDIELQARVYSMLKLGESYRTIKENNAQLAHKNEELEYKNNIIERTNIELEYSNKQMAELNLKLENTNQELESFSYSVSHDLRAPLRSIKGFTQILNEEFEELSDEEKKSYLGKVVKSSSRMDSLINELLNLSVLRRKELNISRVNLSQIAKEYIENYKSINPHREIKYYIEPDIFVDGDKTLLTSVIDNLLGNALKYSSKKSVSQIEFGIAQNNDTENQDKSKVIFVKDNGAGFDNKNAHKLFGVFTRLHSEEEFEGTGIGLANVARIVQKHGGSVWAEGEIDIGATFYFTLRDEYKN